MPQPPLKSSSSSSPPSSSPFPGFKVIIIGAGPAGLSAAHGLALAGIDFLVLERRAGGVVGQIDLGASLVLSPASVRVMQQFGVADRLVHGSTGSGSGCCGGEEDGARGVPAAAATWGGTEVEDNFVLDAKGRVISRTGTARIFRECHGIGQLALHRAELIRALYEGLSAKSRSKILLGQHITDIQQNHGAGDDGGDGGAGGGVRVTCADGTVHTGSIVIGADGVNSFARAAMRRLALADWRQKKKKEKKRAADKEKKSGDGSAASTAPGSSDIHDNNEKIDDDDDNDNDNDDQDLDWDPEDPFPAEYACLWASLPPPPSSSADASTAPGASGTSPSSSSSPSPWAGMTCNTHDAGRSTMHVAGRERSWVFLFEKLAGGGGDGGGPTGRDNKVRYSTRSTTCGPWRGGSASTTSRRRAGPARLTPMVAVALVVVMVVVVVRGGG
ncbi:salicylate hydroxylase [Microdochium nivale]|nr:salicylate hydroxylase [Microdochium nivale]